MDGIMEDEKLTRKRKFVELEIEVNRTKTQRSFQSLLIDNNVREAFKENAFEFNFEDYIRRITAIPRVPGPIPTPLLSQLDAPEPVHCVSCVACTEVCHPSEMVAARCTHSYCDECLENLSRSSMTDETLYPPRCCKLPIRMHDAQEVLPRDLVFEFIDRTEEFETKNKTFCHDPHCATFIRLRDTTGTLARCQECGKGTCNACKVHWHEGECARNDGTEELLAVAQDNMWRQCPECKRFIELAKGCYHITCRCKYEFCYVCGSKWRTCDCRKWDAGRLLERARQLAPNFMPAESSHQDHGRAQGGILAERAQARANTQNQAQAQAALQEQRNQAIQQALVHVENTHECRHDCAFTSYYEYGHQIQCEVYGESYWNWLKQCKTCLMRMCVRCRHNRL